MPVERLLLFEQRDCGTIYFFKRASLYRVNREKKKTNFIYVTVILFLAAPPIVVNQRKPTIKNDDFVNTYNKTDRPKRNRDHRRFVTPRRHCADYQLLHYRTTVG